MSEQASPREGAGKGRQAGRGKETGARAAEGTHLQSPSALPPGGAGPQRCTFFSTRTLRSCSLTVVTSSSCWRWGWGQENGREEIKGKREGTK